MTARPGGHLPLPLSSFIGREDQIAAVRQLIVAERIVTLTGPGGTGKTRLALEAVRRHQQLEGADVCWIDLGPLTDPNLVERRIAQALGVGGSPGEPIGDTLIRELGEVVLLLVLDTCEHLTEAAAGFADRVLRACPGIGLLATTREPLGVPGEITWPVSPLTVATKPTPGSVAASEAGCLFLDRARRVDPDFRLAPDNAAAVVEICRRLDGVPLAIELAAARVRALSPQRIARGLDDRFRLLEGGGPTVEPRHRSLLASIEWSHGLLTSQERAVLRAVGAFAGSFTLDGATAVAAGCGVEPDDVLDLLTGLVDRSLVVADTSSPEPRYHLLDTVRAFARDQLAEHGEEDEVARRHCDHIQRVVRGVAPDLIGPGAADALRSLDREVDDIRRALDWSMRAGDAQRALRMASDLHWFWRVRGLDEGQARIAAALALSGAPDSLRAPALVWLASLEMTQARMAAATSHAAAALDLATRLGDDRTRGRALAWLTWLTILSDDNHEAATSHGEQAVALARATDDRPFEAIASNALGASLIGLPNGTTARQHVLRGVAVAGELGFERPQAEGHLWLAWLDLVEGEFTESMGRVRRAGIPDAWAWEDLLLGVGVGLLAEGLISTGALHQADCLTAETIAVLTQVGEELGAAHVRRARGWLLYARGDLAEASDELARARDVLRHGTVRDGARCRALLALLAARQGERGPAASDLDRTTRHPYIRAAAPALQAVALGHQHAGDPVSAHETWHELLEASLDTGHRPGVCDALDGVAACLAGLERYDDAARLLGAVDVMRATLGYVRFPIDRPSYRCTVERTRTALGHEGYDAAAASGAALSWDDAVEWVRRGRGRRGRPSHGWHSLTPTEHRVVALVADGLTNPQIGETLFVSPRTVQSHLRHVFAKLDVHNRAELAAVAARTAPASRHDT